MPEKQSKVTKVERARRAAEAEDKRILKAFGANLKRLMAEAGYETDWQLMLDSGVNNANIGRYKSGEQEPGLVKIVRLARALGVPATELLRDPRDVPSSERVLQAKKRLDELVREDPSPSPPGPARHSHSD